jgi:threonylcarbamoyladenosine tRNA methylthiotransferase MtaB
MHIHLKALGCRLNEAELDTWSRDFQARGHRMTGDAAEADLVVINTCAVTEEAVRKSRQLVRRAHRANPAAKLVMSGCYASLDPEQAAAELGVDLVVPNPDKDRLVAIASEALQLPTMPAIAAEPGEQALLARSRQRAFIKVQDGCRYRCTYCIVTLARGDERSRPIGEIVAEINRLHASGIQEVVLTGVHLGGYGSDTGSDLYTLVSAVLADTDIPRLRLGSLEPWDLPPGLWALFANPRFMPHLHLPMQSGADSVLRRMARRCKSGEFAQMMAEASSAVPDLNVTTDIIVGFPGESADEWAQTLEFVERMGFGHLHIFAFSPRSGTKAAGLAEPVPRDIKRQRSEQLHALGARLKRQMLERFTGREFEVLVEGSPQADDAGHTVWSGYTPNFLRVAIASDADLENRLLRVRCDAVSADGELLHATPLA